MGSQWALVTAASHTAGEWTGSQWEEGGAAALDAHGTQHRGGMVSGLMHGPGPKDMGPSCVEGTCV